MASRTDRNLIAFYRINLVLQGFLKNIPIESLQLLCGFGIANSSPNGTVYFLDTLPDKLVDIRAEGFELDEFAEIQPWGRDLVPS